MRIVFMGTPEFSVPTLEALARTHDVAAAYTRPDSVSGRGSAARPSAVKEAAGRLGIPVREPRSLRDPAEQAVLASFAPDIIVVAAYGLILPQTVLDVPRLGCVNVHASLLPRWRGAAPVERAILAGDELAGVSIMRMEAGLDTGPYCLQTEVPLDDLTADELTALLAAAGAQALLSSLGPIAEGTARWTRQDEGKVTYAEKIAKDDVALSPELGVDVALRRVRASSRRAPARAALSGRAVTVQDAQREDHAIGAGNIALTDRGVSLGFADGALVVTRLKPDGKSSMSALDWARGARLGSGATWSAA